MHGEATRARLQCLPIDGGVSSDGSVALALPPAVAQQLQRGLSPFEIFRKDWMAKRKFQGLKGRVFECHAEVFAHRPLLVYVHKIRLHVHVTLQLDNDVFAELGMLWFSSLLYAILWQVLIVVSVDLKCVYSSGSHKLMVLGLGSTFPDIS